jgi:hypothetical protein
MAQKVPWWQATNKLWLAALAGGGWLIAGLGDLVTGIVAGKVLFIVLGSIFLLCGAPWYITAMVLLRRRRTVVSAKFPA